MSLEELKRAAEELTEREARELSDWLDGKVYPIGESETELADWQERLKEARENPGMLLSSQESERRAMLVIENARVSSNPSESSDGTRART